MKRSYHVRGATLSNYGEVAGRFGLDAAAMLKRFGIDRRALVDKDARIPAEGVVSLLEASALESGCETFGLRMAEARRLSDFGAVSLLITHQATVREALMSVVGYRQLVNPALVVDVDEHDGIAVVREELLLTGRGAMRQSHELAIGVLYRMFRTLLGPRWRALSANFAHPPPADLTVHRRLFGPICEFNSDFHGLTCGRADLDAPNPSADPNLALLAERYLRTLPAPEGQSLSQDVQKAIHLMLPVGGAAIGRVAASLGFNERTLQRRLAAEGADFAGLLNDVRRELAVRYVATAALPLARAADLLGYARQSSFSRWFAEEFGQSATAWRLSDARVEPEFANV
jgi:AraC-like DNA-binding protein